MLKQKEKVFTDKFNLLNSQENTEDIHWSSSETTDTENTSLNNRLCSLTTNVRSRKRKRKKRVRKNISNLDITILDTAREVKTEKSPIITRRSDKTFLVTSPILKGSPQLSYLNKANRNKPIQLVTHDLKSPILLQKHSSPNASMKTRKQLFKTETCHGRTSPILMTNNCFDSKEKSLPKLHGVTKKTDGDNTQIVSEMKHENKFILRKEKKSESISITDYVKKIERRKHKNKCMKLMEQSCSRDPTILTEMVHETYKDSSVASIENTSIVVNSDESFVIKTNNSEELAKKVKAYFDSHFSSESPSQHSITDTQTPKYDTKSEEIEIISSLTQMTKSNRNSFVSVTKIETPAESFATDYSAERPKKFKYKKDGLAFRLNVLLKKQNANISLWQHEQYLAANSNFEIPKGEHSIFRIRKNNFKYGCYLLDAIDFNDDEFFICINSQFYNCDLNEDAILKLYQPYTVLDCYHFRKLIINACKFECITL